MGPIGDEIARLLTVSNSSIDYLKLDAEITALVNDAIVKPYPPTDDYGPRNRWQFYSVDGKHFLGSEHRITILPYSTDLTSAISLLKKYLSQPWEITIYKTYDDLFWQVTLDVGKKSDPYRKTYRNWHEELPMAVVKTFFDAIKE